MRAVGRPAGSGRGSGYRGLYSSAYREASKQCQTGWELGFAECQVRDPHDVVHEHLRDIYKGRGVPELAPLEGSFVAFTAEEMQCALAQLQRGKSVGRGLTSTELLQALVNIEGGQVHLLEFLGGLPSGATCVE